MVFYIVLVRATIAVTEHQLPKAMWGQMEFISHRFPYKSSSSKAVKAGTWRQELMQRPWRCAAYWLAPHGLLSLLSFRCQDHQPRNGTTHNGPVPPTSITKKIPYSQILRRHFLNGGSLLSLNSSLCQVKAR